METIKLIVKSILVVIMIASFLEVILPRSDMKRYINLIIGLFIIISVMNPILLLVRNGVSFDFFNNISTNSEETNAIITKGKEISKEQKSRAAKNYKDKLAKQIKGLAGLYQGTNAGQVEIDMVDNPEDPKFGEIKKVIVHTLNSNGKDDLSQNSDISQSNIQVEEISITPQNQNEKGLVNKSKKNSQTLNSNKSDTLKSAIADFYGINSEQVEIRK